MGLNSPMPVRLQDETRKAAKILRSFVDSKNNGLDKVIPHNVIEKAAGFAIFTVVKAGFLVSARGGSGVVIARLPDGSWSPPSAIGLGGFGFGGQMGAEVTDFLIVLNSRSAVTSFMSAGSLTLGGNLSIAVGPLGRNAEGSGAVNSKGKVAAMYSYSKTKGLFGGVSVEGTVIIERQDANRIAYGGSVSVKQILTGSIDTPDWCSVLVDQIVSSTGLPYGQKWRDGDQDGEGGAMGYGSSDFDDGYGSPGAGNGAGTRSRGSSMGQGYVFGEGIGSGRNSPNSNVLSEKLESGRRRAGSLLGPNGDKDRPVNKRASSSFNPFSSSDKSNGPKRNPVLASSESYNAGLTWDSDGPMQANVTRPRSSTNPNRSRAGTGGSLRAGGGGGDESELWNNTTGSFAKMAIANGSGSGSGSGSRSRSGSNPPSFDVVPERFDDEDAFNDISSIKADPFSESTYTPPSRNRSRGISSSNLGDPYRSPSPLRNHNTPPQRLAVKEGLDANDGYARAIGLFDFKATTPGDLGFTKGQVVVVLGKEGGDWWKGRDTKGREGIFPSNYVEVVELPKAPKGITRTELKKRMPDLDFE